MKPLKVLSPLHKASRQIEIHLAREMKTFGVSPVEGHLLAYLGSYGPCPIAEIHRVLGTRRSTLTSLLDRLEARGLVVRAAHRADRRSWMISLGTEGHALAAKIRRALESFERAIIKDMTPRDMEGFDRLMEKIAGVTGPLRL